MKSVSLVALFWALLYLSTHVALGQTDSLHLLAPTRAMQMEVKQLQVFADRFNYRKTPENLEPDSAFRARVSRSFYIRSLFDAADARLDSTASAFDASYAQSVDTFIAQVCRHNLRLGPQVDSVFVRANAQMRYMGKTVIGTLYLRKWVYADGATEWRLIDADLPFLQLLHPATFRRGQYTLPPNANETYFMRLGAALDDKAPPTAFIHLSHAIDMLSVWAFATQAGHLQLVAVTDFDYFIYDIPNWEIRLHYYNRPGLNRGWLVANLSHTHQP